MGEEDDTLEFKAAYLIHIPHTYLSRQTSLPTHTQQKSTYPSPVSLCTKASQPTYPHSTQVRLSTSSQPIYPDKPTYLPRFNIGPPIHLQSAYLPSKANLPTHIQRSYQHQASLPIQMSRFDLPILNIPAHLQSLLTQIQPTDPVFPPDLPTQISRLTYLI